MRVEILDKAQADLASGYRFYEKQSPGLGSYFLDSLFADIDSLRLYAGTHPVIHGAHRCHSRRFPFGIFYRIEGDAVCVRAVLDNRQRPIRIETRLKSKS